MNHIHDEEYFKLHDQRARYCNLKELRTRYLFGMQRFYTEADMLDIDAAIAEIDVKLHAIEAVEHDPRTPAQQGMDADARDLARTQEDARQ